jgi:hypothetical protein
MFAGVLNAAFCNESERYVHLYEVTANCVVHLVEFEMRCNRVVRTVVLQTVMQIRRGFARS